MEFLPAHLRVHIKKLLILCTASLSIYLIKRYLDKKKQKVDIKKPNKKIKEFPTVAEIQKFIEDLPFEAVTSGKDITLKDLLGELSEFSEDEEWKELIASVHTMYKDNKSETATRENAEETSSIISIYEDPNVITLSGLSPREDTIDFKSLERDKSDCDLIGTQQQHELDFRSTNNNKNDFGDDYETLTLNLGQEDINNKHM